MHAAVMILGEICNFAGAFSNATLITLSLLTLCPAYAFIEAIVVVRPPLIATLQPTLSLPLDSPRSTLCCHMRHPLLNVP